MRAIEGYWSLELERKYLYARVRPWSRAHTYCKHRPNTSLVAQRWRTTSNGNDQLDTTASDTMWHHLTTAETILTSLVLALIASPDPRYDPNTNAPPQCTIYAFVALISCVLQLPYWYAEYSAPRGTAPPAAPGAQSPNLCSPLYALCN